MSVHFCGVSFDCEESWNFTFWSVQIESEEFCWWVISCWIYYFVTSTDWSITRCWIYVVSPVIIENGETLPFDQYRLKAKNFVDELSCFEYITMWLVQIGQLSCVEYMWFHLWSLKMVKLYLLIFYAWEVGVVLISYHLCNILLYEKYRLVK